MLMVEVDMFSGRPNPAWIVTDADATKDLLGAVREAGDVATKPGSGFTGLGVREVIVTLLGDDEPRPRGVARQFALASTAAKNFRSSGAIARRLVEAMSRHAESQLVTHALTPVTKKMRDLVLERLDLYLERPPRPRPRRPPPLDRNPLRTTVEDPDCTRCRYEVSQFNPAFWNTAAVQPRNNCYNYGRNWRTDTFAQPGRAHGAMTSTMACNTVTTAALADGLRKRCDCLPDSEYPRRLMALVIDPGWDYHWYRHQRGGFWGHKPGGTAARNVDNSLAVITNPETCNRGGYTDFCSYFYAGRSVVIN
jgi:hypothetical protein